jgi:hypothetical protein
MIYIILVTQRLTSTLFSDPIPAIRDYTVKIESSLAFINY